jgi:hypothetical protein
MHEPLFSSWENFYVIMGSSSAALTGLMFVVVTLSTERRVPDPGARREGTATFSTPTVIHFCAAFLVSGIMAAPWASVIYVEAIFGLGGLCGIAYILHIMRRAKRMTLYTPDTEDWVWFVVLPLVAYVLITVSAVLLVAASTASLFVLAGATMMLIFIGIHNAWDVVTYLAIEQNQD